MKLYGKSTRDDGKKLNRVTVALSSADYKLVEAIADAKGLSNSEVINLLIKPTMKLVEEQEELIKESPLSVAFDLITGNINPI
jgi:hypothetical protein